MPQMVLAGIKSFEAHLISTKCVVASVAVMISAGISRDKEFKHSNTLTGNNG